MKSLLILFAIVAVVAAYPEPERERRGILGAPAILSPTLAVPRVVGAPVAVAAAPNLLAAPVPAIAAAPALAAAPLGLRLW